LVGSSGLGQSIATLPQGIDKKTIASIHGIPENINWNQYKSIDVIYGASEIVIAYKKSKTSELHNKALAIAINKMLDISKEELIQYWIEDFSYRQKVWSNCKATGEEVCQE